MLFEYLFRAHSEKFPSSSDLRRESLSKMTDQFEGLSGQNRALPEKNPELICTCELHNGYIFKNYFACNSVKGRPVITFVANGITAGNRSVDNQIYVGSYIHGDEMNMTWSESIPLHQRKFSLTYDATTMQATISRIKKKDQARIIIAQNRFTSDPHNFSGPNSSDEFIIYLSCGTGGDGREGLRSIPTTRVEPDNTIINYPKDDYWMLVIPVPELKKMIDSFSKCKKEIIRMKYYPNTSRGAKTRPGLILGTVVNGVISGIIEKFGDIPEDADENDLPAHSWQRSEESSIVRFPGSQLVIEVERQSEPSEFDFTADKIATFAKFVSMHNESSVRIYYQPSKHLLLAYRFGAFGEAEICLSNRCAKF